MKDKSYELLVCVLNKPEAVEDVVAAFLEVGVTGCTIIDSKGMGKVIGQDIPIFSGFKSMFSGAREMNVTIFSVMETKTVDCAIRIIEEVYSNFSEPSTGIVFTVPVRRVKGLLTNP
jgi:nitrogen regulatory protein PII